MCHPSSDFSSSGRRLICPFCLQSFLVFQRLAWSRVNLPLVWNTMLFLSVCAPVFLLIMIKDTHCKCVQWFAFCHAQRLIELFTLHSFLKLSASLKVRFLSRKRVIPRHRGAESGRWRSHVELEALSLPGSCAVYFTHEHLCSSLEAHDVISFDLNMCLFTVT